MSKHWPKISLMLAIGAFATSTAHAAVFATGDVFASVGNGLVNVYSPGGVLQQTLDTGKGAGIFTTGSAANTTTGNFFVTDFNANAVTEFNNNGVKIGDFGSGYSTDPESILFDKSGNVFVGQADTSHHVLEFNSAGTLINTFAPATQSRGTDWIDLASDQTTLYYTSEGTAIKRFDTVSGQLTDLISTLPGVTAYALRILGDGSVLVADSSAVERVSAAGAIIQSYAITGSNTGLFSLNLDPDGTSFWTGDFNTGDLYKINIATGALEQTIVTGSSALFGVSVYGEVTQATSTPEPAQLGTSLALIGLLALFGYRRSKKAAENA